MNEFWAALGIVSQGIWSVLLRFTNSIFFSSLATFFTVYGAVYLYIRQKTLEKQRIAGSLVNEIRNAEEAISSLRQHSSANKGNDLPEIIILPQNSWNKYSHLFTKDLDQDQIKTINRFYFEAEIANQIVSHGNSSAIFLSNIKARTQEAHRVVLDLIEKAATPADVKSMMALFYSKFDEGAFQYSPQGFKNELDAHLSKITFILDSPSGLKLKELSGELPKQTKKKLGLL